MTWNQEDIDLLEAYQAGYLSDLEMKEVDLRLSDDQEFKDLYTELSNYQAGIRRVGRKALKEELQQLEQTLPEITDGRSVSIFRPNLWLRAAAGITIIFGLGILFFLMNEEPIDIDTYLEPYPNIVYPVERNAEGESLDQRQLAYQAYDRAQYAKAVERFVALSSMSAEDQFYLGLSYMLQEEYDQARKTLSEVLEADSDLMIPTRWYLGLCYLKFDNKSAAREVWQPLIDQKTSYADKAKNILNQTN